MTNRFVRFGACPRGVQALVLAAKVRAMLDERYHVSFDDIADRLPAGPAAPLLLNFEGQAEGIATDDLLNDILQECPETAGPEGCSVREVHDPMRPTSRS